MIIRPSAYKQLISTLTKQAVDIKRVEWPGDQPTHTVKYQMERKKKKKRNDAAEAAVADVSSNSDTERDRTEFQKYLYVLTGEEDIDYF